jgi:predicted GIY-YIG superfamily endonuclease
VSFGWASQPSLTIHAKPATPWRRSAEAGPLRVSKSCVPALLGSRQQLHICPTVCRVVREIETDIRLHPSQRGQSTRSVYVLRSTIDPNRYYTGMTTDIAVRLAVHNSGGYRHTSTLRPWQLLVSLEFDSESTAIAFEKYLKSGSGRAFAKKHFV